MEENEGLLNKILNAFSKQEGIDDLLAMTGHWNGYKRENAVRRLGMLGNPIAIPKLIVRANDWVPQVRAAAKGALEKLLKDENAEAFVLSLPDLYHLQRCGRDDHSPLLELVNRFLVQPQNAHHVVKAIRSDTPYVARIALRLTLQHTLIDRDELVAQCLTHRDPIVRSLAADLLRGFSGKELESLLDVAIKDPFMPIRREAFQLYLKRFPERGLITAKRLLFDRHVAIRDIAIKQLMKNDVDVELTFTNVLTSNTQRVLKLRCAILGLAEIGARQTLPLITEFAAHPLPSVRKAALQALAKLLGENAGPHLINGLKDASPAVAKEAVRLLDKETIRLSPDELSDIIRNANHHHTLSVCLASSRKINKWDRLLLLLTLFTPFILNNNTKADELDKAVTQWNTDFNRSSSQPDRLQIEKIEAEYRRAGMLLSGEKYRVLAFTLSGIGIRL